MQNVALYNEEVTGPEHAVIVGNRACRAVLGDRGVAHLTISKDVQMMKRSADRKSMRNPGVRTSSSWTAPLAPAPADADSCISSGIVMARDRIFEMITTGETGLKDQI